jgi:hypothetical protein
MNITFDDPLADLRHADGLPRKQMAEIHLLAFLDTPVAPAHHPRCFTAIRAVRPDDSPCAIRISVLVPVIDARRGQWTDSASRKHSSAYAVG